MLAQLLARLLLLDRMGRMDAVEAVRDGPLALGAPQLLHGAGVEAEQVAVLAVAVQDDGQQHAVVLGEGVGPRDEDGLARRVAPRVVPVQRLARVEVRLGQAVEQGAVAPVRQAVEVAVAGGGVGGVDGRQLAHPGRLDLQHLFALPPLSSPLPRRDPELVPGEAGLRVPVAPLVAPEGLGAAVAPQQHVELEAADDVERGVLDDVAVEQGVARVVVVDGLVEGIDAVEVEAGGGLVDADDAAAAPAVDDEPLALLGLVEGLDGVHNVALPGDVQAHGGQVGRGDAEDDEGARQEEGVHVGRPGVRLADGGDDVGRARPRVDPEDAVRRHRPQLEVVVVQVARRRVALGVGAAERALEPRVQLGLRREPDGLQRLPVHLLQVAAVGREPQVAGCRCAVAQPRHVGLHRDGDVVQPRPVLGKRHPPDRHHLAEQADAGVLPLREGEAVGLPLLPDLLDEILRLASRGILDPHRAILVGHEGEPVRLAEPVEPVADAVSAVLRRLDLEPAGARPVQRPSCPRRDRALHCEVYRPLHLGQTLELSSNQTLAICSGREHGQTLAYTSQQLTPASLGQSSKF